MLAVVPIPGFFEPFGSMLHLLAAAVVAGLGAWLVRRGNTRGERIALLGFVVASTAMLALSGTYHLLDEGTVSREVLRRLDHAAIWTMIAASLTAIHATAFRGSRGSRFIGVVWTVALAGLVFKTVFFHALPDSIGLALYLALGWFGVVSAFALRRAHGAGSIRDLIWGGVAYSVGAAYDFANGPALIPDVVGPHEIFHVAVVLGVALHWRFIADLADARRCLARWSRARLCVGPGGYTRIR